MDLKLNLEPDLELELELEPDLDLDPEPELEPELDLDLESELDLELETDLGLDPTSPNVTLTMIPTLMSGEEHVTAWRMQDAYVLGEGMAGVHLIGKV